MWAALLAIVAVAVAELAVLHPTPPVTALRLWFGIALPYVGLGLLAVYRTRRDGSLARFGRFRPGDPSLGIGLAIALLLTGWALSRWLVPLDSPARAWQFRIAVAARDLSSASATACLMAIAGLEELVWRGWVQDELVTRWGPRRGWMVCAVSYALAHGTTLVTLADPLVGHNPLVLLGALGCGLSWSFLRAKTGRITPGVFSHAAMSYLGAQYLGQLV